MSRILKALLKTILCILFGILLFVLFFNFIPFVAMGIIITILIIELFLSFYFYEED